MSLYNKRGVSAQKEEVHAAVQHLDQGLYAHAFCKIYKDFLGGDSNWVNVMHADGAGTKSILAYLYWKETGDISVWKGIAQDAVVMNLDDLLCVGIYDNIVFNSTIDRNKHRIPGEILSEIINGTQLLFDSLQSFGVNIYYLGGETADVGDVVRTIAVNGTMTCRWPKSKLITNDKIAPGDVIVGLASFGQASYETEYNSGLGSNGLTSARHDVLSKWYAENFKESYDNKKPIIIDPFISSTNNLNGVNAGKAKDIDYDYAGNVYVTGGGGVNESHRLAKYSAVGILQWTFNGFLSNPVWEFGKSMGGWVVEKTNGNIYLGQGGIVAGFRVVRLNTNGLYDNYISAADGNFQENWKMYWSCVNGSPQILIGGGG